MDRHAILRLLDEVRSGRLDADTAAERLAAILPGVPGGAGGGATPAGAGSGPPVVFHVDHQRALRCGASEVVLGSGKEPDDLVRIAHEVLARSPRLLVTRVDAPRVRALQAAFADAVHHVSARCVSVEREARPVGRTGVLILTAGTADVPVAEEARVTATLLGEAPETLYDVGVAGLHRLTSRLDVLRRARVLVVVAGMDGALPSVVGGLVAVPVIAVPSSVGYGLGLGGIAPLLAMANACAPNVTFVNIDNGFGAGYVASLINRGDGRAAAQGP